MSENVCQVSTVLDDRTCQGKKRDWALHKLHSGYISLAYRQVDNAKALRMASCADWLSFVWEEGRLKLHDARFCRVRLCPVCQWRRSLKTFAQMSQVLEVARSYGFQFLFLTLTVRNCSGENLSGELDKLMLAFNRLMKYKTIKQVVHGYYRGCEVTHNLSDDTYHPHLHCILAVKPGYFSGKYYLSQVRFSELWQKALHVDYTPIVDIRRCRGGSKAIAEACKYSVKPSDIICFDDWDLTVDTVRVLDSALAQRRFVGLGGILKDIHKKLHLDDMDDGDLVHASDDDDKTHEPTESEIMYFWDGYNQYRFRE